MGYITSNTDSRLIKFEVRIQCYECTSYNCQVSVKEPDELRYRCLDCNSIVDKESG